MQLPIADCRLPIAGLAVGCGFARRSHDGSQFIRFLQKGSQLSGGHDAGLYQQFEPKRRLIRFFFDSSDFGNELRPASGATASSVIRSHGSAAANDLPGYGTRSVVVFRNRPCQFDDSQHKRFCPRFQVGRIHNQSVRIQSAIGNRQSAISK